jgi:hypothetical protein
MTLPHSVLLEAAAHFRLQGIKDWLPPEIIGAFEKDPTVSSTTTSNPLSASTLVVKQVDDGTYFRLDTTQTYANPDPPQLGGTEYFTLSGIYVVPFPLIKTEFICHLLGVPV